MIRTSLKIAFASALALATLAPAALQARDTGAVLMRGVTPLKVAPMTRAPVAIIKMKFNCVVAGTPTEFPNDIAISHNYGFTVPAGTKVAYTAPYGNTGIVTLPALAPGTYFFVYNAIPGGMQAGAPCSASQI
jgi:hypothetical protein